MFSLKSMLTEIEAELNDGLTKLGFVSRGKSFVRTVNDRQLAIIALTGRFSQAGAKCFVICFRHTFLRDLESEIPDPFPLNAHNFPVKLSPDELQFLSIDSWQYRSDLLRYPFGYLSSQKQASQFVHLVATCLLPWSEALTASKLHEEILQHGQDGYIERIWLDDYTNRITA